MPNLIERQAITVLSGDTGTCKSILAMALSVAIVRGESWIGRPVEQGRVSYLDEENPERIVLDRLWALGAGPTDSESLRYFNRQGVRLGSGTWAEQLHTEVREHRPLLVVIDTAMAACAVEVNDNSAVVALFTGVLRPLASDNNLALLILHHERKPGASEKRNAGQAMMGARQWAGQADTHLAAELPPRPYEQQEDPHGHRIERYRVRLRTPKLRDSGDREHVERIVVESERTTERALRRLTICSEGVNRDGRAGHDAEAELVRRIHETVQARGESSTAEIAAGVDADPGSGTFKRALRQAVEEGLIVHVRRGHYSLPETSP